jgi:CopG family transcriptional regulator, nickel-responsive regulator
MDAEPEPDTRQVAPAIGVRDNRRMSELSRIGVAIDSDLLEAFDRLIAERGYASRSEAFRDMVRDALINQAAASDRTPVVGTITLVYDHHQRMLSDRLTAAQHEFHHAMLSTLHVHLDHDNCLEVVVVRGPAGQVRHVADTLISMKGVKHGRLTLTSGQPSSAEKASRAVKRSRHESTFSEGGRRRRRVVGR